MTDPFAFEVLPCHPAPAPGECLTGYLARLAEANGATVWDLAADCFPAWAGRPQLPLLRWEYPVEDWGRLPLRAWRQPDELSRLTVWPWVAKFREPPRIAHPSNRSPANALRGVLAPTLRVCPRCLDAAPYTRLLWRLAAVTACLEHGCLLQDRCPRCARPLAPIRPAQRPGRCAACDADLRSAQWAPADEATLDQQAQRQAALRFLLDPATALVPASVPGADRSRAIGDKLRYLRTEAGWSVAALARRLAIPVTTIPWLELGHGAALLPLYLAYLDALALSWPAFAALEVPEAFLRRQREPPHPSLRRCPVPACPHHAAPSTTGVILLRDHPDRQVARFRCKACGRRFTRRYDGALAAKPRRPPLRPGEPPPVKKTAADVARLVALGRQGLPNRQIARTLGWGEKTVRMYWIALDVEAAIHAAQARWRARAVAARHAAVGARVEQALATLLQGEEEITVHAVGRALGQNEEYLRMYPEIVAAVQQAASRRNAEVRALRHATVGARVVAALADLRDATIPPSARAVAERAGVDPERLHATHPALYTQVRAAVDAQRAARRDARQRRQLAQIDAAAARLSEQGTPLTYTGLLTAAGVDHFYGYRNPAIHQRLEQWLGGSPRWGTR